MKNTIALLSILIFLGADISAQTFQAAWIRTITTSEQSSVRMIDFWVDPTGSAYYLGYCYEDIFLDQGLPVPSTGNEQLFLAKYEADGSFGWVRAFGNYTFSGGHLSGDTDGNLYLGGAFHGSVPFGNNVQVLQSCSNCTEIFIAKYHPDGVAQWAKTIQAENNTNFQLSGLELDANGHIYVSGFFDGETLKFPGGSTHEIPAGSGFFVAQLDQNAKPVWVRSLESGSSAQNLLMAVSQNGTCFLFGAYGQTLHFTPFDQLPYYGGFYSNYVAAYSSEGQFLWAKNLHSSSFIGINDLKADERGGVYFASYAFDPLLSAADTIIPAGPGELAGFLLRIDEDTKVAPVLARHGFWANSISTVTVAPDRKFYTGGYFYDSLFTTVNNQAYTCNGDADIMICGGRGTQLESVSLIGGPYYEDISNTLGGTAMGLDTSGNLFISGFFSPSLSIDPLAVSGHGAYIAKLKSLSVSTSEPTPFGRFSVSPNPASGPFEVRFEEETPEGTLVLFDLQGRERYRARVAKNVQTIDPELPAGVYFLQWEVGGRVNGVQKVCVLR